MDALQYWTIAERDIEIQNPITDRKLRLLDDYCDLRDGLKILDLGCGKAWLLRRWAADHAIDGTGVDINPAFLDFARTHAPQGDRLQFVEASLADYAAQPASFDIVLCLGAVSGFGGTPQALDWMSRVVKPGGAMVLGDMVLRHRPEVDRGAILPPETFEMVHIVERHGAEVTATISASDADFERYASHHRHNTLKWGREHPDDPAQAAMLKKSHDDWQYYHQTIRPMLGWTIFVGRRRD